jgi:hypothetical protein
MHQVREYWHAVVVDAQLISAGGPAAPHGIVTASRAQRLQDSSPATTVRAYAKAAAVTLDASDPDPAAAAAFAAAAAAVSLQEGLPNYKVGLVTPKKVTVVLHAGEAPIKFFHSLKGAQLRVADGSIP